jgi:hypothetical protein
MRTVKKKNHLYFYVPNCRKIIINVMKVWGVTPRFLSSAPLSPRFRFKRAFEPSLPSFRARLWALTSFSSAPFSPRFLSSTPSLPFKRPFEPSLSFQAPLWALASFSSSPESPRFLYERAFEPSYLFERDFEPSHPFECIIEPSRPFKCTFEPSFFFFFFTWVGHPSQWDPFFFYLGRSPITMRPLLYIYIYIYI